MYSVFETEEAATKKTFKSFDSKKLLYVSITDLCLFLSLPTPRAGKRVCKQGQGVKILHKKINYTVSNTTSSSSLLRRYKGERTIRIFFQKKVFRKIEDGQRERERDKNKDTPNHDNDETRKKRSINQSQSTSRSVTPTPPRCPPAQKQKKKLHMLFSKTFFQ